MRRVALPVLFALVLASLSTGQVSYPMVTHCTPVAIQRGTTAEIVVEGQQNFWGATAIVFEGTGLTGVPSDPVAPLAPGAAPPLAKSAKFKVTATPDAKPGVREFRVITRLGVSSVGQILVADSPVIPETANNNTRDKATPVTLPCTIVGRIEVAEDVDFFAFKAMKGEVISAEVICARIQDKIHDLQKHADPLIALYDSNGRELASNDDFFFADPYLSYKIPADGTYYLEVRDSKYDGDPRWVYAVILTNQSHVTHVYPMAGNPGQKVNVEAVGFVSGAGGPLTITAPMEPGLHLVPLDGVKTNPVPFLVSDLPQVLEKEPNDTPETAQVIPIPCGINGRIQAPRDMDYYKFTASKGQPLRFEVKARRFGTDLVSSLDSFLEILSTKGAVLASNDDLVGKDAGLIFTPTADGEYLLRIRDLNSKGGPTAIYYLECERAKPDFTIRCDGDKAMFGPGTSTSWYVHVVRSNGFDGPVDVKVEGLPAGVIASTLTIPPTMTQGVLVLTATEGAALGTISEVRIKGSAMATFDGKPMPLERISTPNQEIYFPGGGRGRFDVRMSTVGVTEPSDIKGVQVTPEELKLKPGAEIKLDVVVERKPGFDKPVQLDIIFRHLGTQFGNPLPPGVAIVENKSKTLLGTGNTGHIVLKVDPKAAPIEKVPISVLAHTSINFVVKMTYSSKPILLTIEK
jgi:hypothetical protein